MKPVLHPVDEKLLLIDLKSGDEAAFRYFYNEYHVALYRRLLKLVQLEVIAEELLQDLFIRIWQKRILIDPEQSFKAYLYRIAEHIVADHYRKLARQVKLERDTDVQLMDLKEANEETFFSIHAEKIINEAIEQLPAQQQKIFRWCKIEGKSYEEVSQLLNISHATINTHISRASKAIKAYILKHHDGAMTLAGAYAILDIVHILPTHFSL